MSAAARYLSSSIGRKQILGLCGAYLYFFLLVHLVGNIGLLEGPEYFDGYGHLMLHTLAKVVVPVEFTLLAAFLTHMILGFRLTAENRAARPQRYAVRASKSGRTGYGAYMMVSGSWLLVFVLVHVPHFRFGAYRAAPTAVYGGVEMRDLYGEVMRSFGHLWFTAFYVFSFALLFTHLAHGVQSSLQSLGVNHPRYQGALKKLSTAYAVVICGGFSALAIWAYLHASCPVGRG